MMKNNHTKLNKLIGEKQGQVLRQTVARNLRAIMGAQAVNQTELSRDSGVSSIQVSNILNCKNSPRFVTLSKFAVVLGVDANEFFKEELIIKSA